MKFLEYTPLSRLGSFLQCVDLQGNLVTGEIQAYSCKLAGIDKKLSRSLDQDVITALASTPPDLLSASPVGPLTEANSRKTLIYLILTLNHMYPDYDFSLLRAHHFRKEADLRFAKSNIDSLLTGLSKQWAEEVGGDNPFLDVLWSAIDEVIGLGESVVYCYNADMDGDPFAEAGNLWAFNYFFYNKKLRRILYFSCRCKNKPPVEQLSDSDEFEYDNNEDDYGDFADDMDMT